MLPTLARLSVRPLVLWTFLPSHLPYSAGLLPQESLVQARLSAKAALLAQQERTHEDKQAMQRVAETDVLLLQHSPVYTAGRREKDADVAHEEGERVRKLWEDYVQTMRGGQTTYHGPGQLVGYPALDLAIPLLALSQVSLVAAIPALSLPPVAHVITPTPISRLSRRDDEEDDISAEQFYENFKDVAESMYICPLACSAWIASDVYCAAITVITWGYEEWWDCLCAECLGEDGSVELQASWEGAIVGLNNHCVEKGVAGFTSIATTPTSTQTLEVTVTVPAEETTEEALSTITATPTTTSSLSTISTSNATNTTELTTEYVTFSRTTYTVVHERGSETESTTETRTTLASTSAFLSSLIASASSAGSAARVESTSSAATAAEPVSTTAEEGGSSGASKVAVGLGAMVVGLTGIYLA
ncbi:hypothetical protein JCM8547_007150 [Rhodosporidiobolus lusitaniae]